MAVAPCAITGSAEFTREAPLNPRKSLQRKGRSGMRGDESYCASDNYRDTADQCQSPHATKLAPFHGDNLIYLNRFGLSFDEAGFNSGHRKPVRPIVGRDDLDAVTGLEKLARNYALLQFGR
jgi:hypothetical protein